MCKGSGVSWTTAAAQLYGKRVVSLLTDGVVVGLSAGATPGLLCV
jgi:hypothetical protein